MSDPTSGSLVTSPPEQPGPVAGTSPAGALTGKQDKPRGLFGDAWYDLRRKPLFWISAAFITLFILMAAFPFLFTTASPTLPVGSGLSRSLEGPSGDAWFGTDIQGRDIFARTIYGARASIIVAVSATLGTVLLGAAVGVLAGFRGGWVDALLSRLADVFFGIPFVLGAIVILFTFNPRGAGSNEWKIMGLVILALCLLVWPVAMRIMRSSVLAAKQSDYVVAARALGASNTRIIFKHLIPNCLAPVLVYATILIGAYIGAEATLSFLGVGLQSPVVSWGVMISDSQNYLRVAWYWLLFPSAFLITAVLSFVMLGEAVREALDPKLR
ncbi:ABC transporter permease [Phytohabitans suffuscus]|uniref:Peptide ABC transporter permease n=1 Tax=Phytohabitans suffuscus TaxID=624315 RepID=A0A6F8YLD3_9ACTN|nr:ABC transporter permease [Phytohabitans suffuscus]BCB86853.1 peptide ABC transporter permease [Phytohabitans suffuscus]